MEFWHCMRGVWVVLGWIEVYGYGISLSEWPCSWIGDCTWLWHIWEGVKRSSRMDLVSAQKISHKFITSRQALYAEVVFAIIVFVCSLLQYISSRSFVVSIQSYTKSSAHHRLQRSLRFINASNERLLIDNPPTSPPH